MLARSVALKLSLVAGLTVGGLTVAPLVSADNLTGSLVSGLSLSTSGTLVAPEPEAIDPTLLNDVAMEEIVITGHRTHPRTKPIDPALQRVFNERDRMKMQRSELEWLELFAQQRNQRVAIGYDPHFEFRNRQVAQPFESGLNERPAVRVLRVEF